MCPTRRCCAANLGKPLTSVPDPFGTHDSYGAHNNARLRAFLDRFGFDYEFLSATDCYKCGRFDTALLTVLAHYEKVIDVVLPTLGAERRDLFAVPSRSSRARARCCWPRWWNRDVAKGTIVYARKTASRDRSRHRRPLQTAMEGRLGHALACARHRLRNVRQGSLTSPSICRRDLQDRGRHAAGAVQLRIVPRRERPAHFEIARQRPHHRRMAGLRTERKHRAVHVPEAARGEAALFRRDPQGGGRLHRPA